MKGTSKRRGRPGLLPQKLRVAVDSSPVRGRGAVKDTFSLLSDAIAAVVRTVAKTQATSAEVVACKAGLARPIETPSIKGAVAVNWDDHRAVSGFLDGLLADAGRVVALAEQAGCTTDEVALLTKVIAQHVEQATTEDPPRIRQGVAPDRTVSVQDPEMRPGHKSNGKGYSGHKAHVAAELTSGIITAVTVTVPGEPDGAQVQPLVVQIRQLSGRPVEQLTTSCFRLTAAEASTVLRINSP